MIISNNRVTSLLMCAGSAGLWVPGEVRVYSICLT